MGNVIQSDPLTWNLINFFVLLFWIWIDWGAAPHLTGSILKLFVRIIEIPIIGSLIISFMKKENNMVEVRCFVSLSFFGFNILTSYYSV